jgi:oxygen-dependent protoporphyrinogen oxidase
MPRFLQMEEHYGSIIRAMWREQRAARARKRKGGGMTGGGSDSGARYSLFVSFKNGLQTLVDTLVSRLPTDAVQANRRVVRVEPASGQMEENEERRSSRWRIILDDGARLEADGVIIAGPAHNAAALVENFDAGLAAQLTTIHYASSVVVSVAYRQSDIPRPLDGFGFVVPAVEQRSIIACSLSSVKFAGRAPEGHILLRCFIGGGIQQHAYEWEDGEMVTAVRKEMKDLLGIEAAPLFTIVHRHPRSMPQYPVGHLQHVARIAAHVAQYPGLALAGNAYGGVGIPDCVKSGEEAADSLVATLAIR